MVTEHEMKIGELSCTEADAMYHQSCSMQVSDTKHTSSATVKPLIKECHQIIIENAVPWKKSEKRQMYSKKQLMENVFPKSIFKTMTMKELVTLTVKKAEFLDGESYKIYCERHITHTLREHLDDDDYDIIASINRRSI